MSIKGFNINGTVQKYDYRSLDNLPGDTGLSEQAKRALLACFEKVAWIDGNGQNYYDELEAALYPQGYASITNILTGCRNTNETTSLALGTPYNATIEANNGYTLVGADVSITMGGTSVTGYYSNGTISIPNVTGDIVITVTAASAISSIAATFVQGSAVICDTDSLDTLKQYLTVTANYSDGTSATVTDYTLSGTLAVGSSTITASYGGKTDTFTVTVSYWNYEWDYTKGKLEETGMWEATKSGTTTSTIESDGQKLTANNSSQIFINPDGVNLRQKTVNGKGVIEVVAALNISTSVSVGLKIGIGEAISGGTSSGVSITTAKGTLMVNQGSSSNVSTGKSISSGTDYTFRLELNETVGYVYLNGKLAATVSNATATKYAGAYYVAWQNGSSSTYYALIKSIKIRNGGV